LAINLLSSSFIWLSSFLSFSYSFYSSGTTGFGSFLTNLEKNEPNFYLIDYSSSFTYEVGSSSFFSSFYSSSSTLFSSAGGYSYFLLKKPPNNDFKFTGFFSYSYSFSFSFS
jgi:hypothetical protein